jgi:hypothetical protein
MVNSELRPGASLPELLAARARAASDGRLVLDVWGIADRELGERTTTIGMSTRALRLLRLLAVAIGGTAAVTLLLAALGVVLGPLKS